MKWLQARLFDYECITEDGANNRPRLVAFGKFAGMAGMIDGLQGLGLKLLAEGASYSRSLLLEDAPKECSSMETETDEFFVFWSNILYENLIFFISLGFTTPFLNIPLAYMHKGTMTSQF